jgi:hypothetical protein
MTRAPCSKSAEEEGRFVQILFLADGFCGKITFLKTELDSSEVFVYN